MIANSWIAIDPGAVHCGIAFFDELKCVGAFTRTPEQLFHGLETIDAIALWVVEEFRLYPWIKQDFDEMLTPETIGVIKYIAKKRGIPVKLQPAMIKKPTRGHLRSRRIELLDGTTHAKDAQLHGYFHMFNPKEGRWVN